MLAAFVATSLLSILAQIFFWTIGIGCLVGFVMAVNAKAKTPEEPESD